MGRIGIRHIGTALAAISLTICVHRAAAGPRGAQHPIPADRIIKGHAGPVVSLAFLPDGFRAVSGSTDHTLKLWDVRSGELLHTFEGHEAPVYAVAVSHDGRRLASGGADHTVRVWDVASGDMVGLLEGHTGNVNGIAFLPDGRLLSGAGDGLRLWDVAKEKLLWRTPPSQCSVYAMALAADGKRVAVVASCSGAIEVWDLVDRRQLGTFGEPKQVRRGVAISADGRHVYGHTGDGRRDFAGWDVDAVKQLPVAPSVGGARNVQWLPGGRSLAICDGLRAGTWDAVSGQQLNQFKVGPDGAQSVAVSPDGRTLLAGGGRDANGLGGPRAEGTIAVYTVPNPADAARLGPAEGSLSWEVIPASVLTLAGETVPVTTRQYGSTDYPDALDARVRNLAPGLDAVWTIGAVLLHNRKGVLREALVDPEAVFTDVVWDGTYAYAVSRTKGITVLDRTGKVVRRIGPDEGLPPSDIALVVHPIGAGTLLAAGVSGEPNGRPGTGWCAVIDVELEDKRPLVTVFLHEPQLPGGWNDGVRRDISSFRPLWAAEVPAAPAGPGGVAGARSVWIACNGNERSPTPVLRIDPKTLSASAYNLAPKDRKPGSRGPWLRAFPEDCLPYWVNDREMLINLYEGQVIRATAGDQLVDAGDEAVKLVCDATGGGGRFPLLDTGDGQLYVPGRRWRRIDTKTLEAEDIGPGLRVDGEPVSEHISYFVSGHFGMAAFSLLDGCFYRFSVDPAHPGPVHATADLPIRRPVPAAGVIERAGQYTICLCGQGSVNFNTGIIGPSGTLSSVWADPRAERGTHLSERFDLFKRLSRFPSETQRIGLTPDQWKLVAAWTRRPHDYAFTGDETKRLQDLHAAYAKAPDGTARDQAGKALLDEVKAIGEKQSAVEDDDARQFRSIFSSRQWKLLHYQKPGPDDH